MEEVRCKRTHRLEARKNESGMFLYCKGCKQEHFHTWEELQRPAPVEEVDSSQQVQSVVSV